MIRLAIDKPVAKTRVVVAMSGGVDSSTVAALLHEAGYEVIGITLQLYDFGETLKKKGACCAGQDIHDAKTVAESLGIPHYVLNYENLFKESVMEDFAESYMRGETPVPCIRCNQSVKFRDLLKVAKDLGADGLATGHYIQRFEGTNGPELHRGADFGKDQSYFLFATTAEQLAFTHFPLGGMSKEETRAHAKRFGLIVADKPDSQDICFVPNGDYAKVVARLRPQALEPGEIVHIDGRVLGQHEGVIHFTVGQRKGLKIAHPEPLYVIRIEPQTRRVIVGEKEALGKARFGIKDMNWIADSIPAEGLSVEVRVRSSQPLMPATIFPDGTVELFSAYPAISPGQACVAYHGTRVLGGGWIMREDEVQKAA